MQNTIQEYLGQVKIGRQQSFRNLAMFPLLSAYSAPLDYLTLDEALSAGLMEIREVDTAGSVPDLRVINRAEKMVLILDGEELVGAKQNRIVNTTILVAAQSTLVIPVSCVEQGRWSYRSASFESQDRMMGSQLRAALAAQVAYSIQTTGERRADQGAIWQNIAEHATRRRAAAATGAMTAIYEKDAPALGEYVRHFKIIEGQVGAVFLINGRIAGLDAFGRPGTFKTVFKKLAQSYALDAVDRFDPKDVPKVLRGPVTKFIRECLSAETDFHPAVGLGTDFRLESKRLTGFALVLEEHLLHLSAFGRQNGSGAAHSRMGSFSRRRRNRV